MDYQPYRGISVAETRTEVDRHLELLKRLGYFIVPEIFSAAELERLRRSLDTIWERQLQQYGAELLTRIGDFGVCRGMMQSDEVFQELIVHPRIMEYVAKTVGETAILHLQNGIILFPDT